jgi:transposase-like protein
VLMQLSKMEQRYDAVLGVLRDCFTVTEVAQKFNVSRQTVHVWLAHYRLRGARGAVGNRKWSNAPHGLARLTRRRSWVRLPRSWPKDWATLLR